MPSNRIFLHRLQALAAASLIAIHLGSTPTAANKLARQVAVDDLVILNGSQKATLRSWLSKHPGYRPIASNELGKRTYPYAAVGDFNFDGHGDFAILLTRVRGGNNPKIFLVFNGPSKTNNRPNYWFSDGLQEGDILQTMEEKDVRPPHRNGHSLSVGPGESDNIYYIVPRGAGYMREYEAISADDPG
jgi:hypothetical protein